MLLKIENDFDLKKIQISGQCFRVKETEPGVFRFITGENVVYIREAEDVDEASQEKDAKKDGVDEAGNAVDDVVGGAGCKCFEVSCSNVEWKEVWEPYFDMSRNYSEICKKEYGRNDFTDRAIDCGRGLRILKQDKWEMLISFIISQRKSIPAISSAVEAVSRKFGTRIETRIETSVSADGNRQKEALSKGDDSSIYAFPTPEQMAGATLDDLKECGLGYRAPYVLDAIRRVLEGELDLEGIDSLDDEGLFQKLMEVHGVGMKVSNCVCLFAYARMGRAPVDVWIARAIDEHYGGVNPFPEYGDNAGIIQQYIFYYMKNN